MNEQTDLFASAVETLQRALAEEATQREEDWIARMDQALQAIRQAVRQRDADLKSCGGQLVDLDRPLQGSPTMDRLADGLRHELDGVLEEVASLRAKVRGAASGATSDLGALRSRGTRLLDALRRFEREEARVVLESVTTDIGCGD